MDGGVVTFWGKGVGLVVRVIGVEGMGEVVSLMRGGEWE